MAVFGTVNEKYVLTTATAVNSVTAPVVFAPVVGVVVVRLVNCVTATPAPVAYPMPPAPVDRTLVVAVTVVNAPVEAVVAPTVVPLIAPPVMATALAACVDIVPRPDMSVFGIVADAVRAAVPVPLTYPEGLLLQCRRWLQAGFQTHRRSETRR